MTVVVIRIATLNVDKFHRICISIIHQLAVRKARRLWGSIFRCLAGETGPPGVKQDKIFCNDGLLGKMPRSGSRREISADTWGMWSSQLGDLQRLEFSRRGRRSAGAPGLAGYAADVGGLQARVRPLERPRAVHQTVHNDRMVEEQAGRGAPRVAHPGGEHVEADAGHAQRRARMTNPTRERR